MSAQVAAAAITSSVALAVALIGTFATYRAAKRDRRRQLYGEATKAALAWHEMLYRVRRRRDGADAAAVLVERFHDLQEAITYHSAWIGAESRSLERSYQHLVREVKTKTEHHITDAWNAPVRPLPGNAQSGDAHPSVQAEADSFLKDVRSHLSLQPWRRLALWWRSKSY